jgi:predicted metal-dependent phosphoesterase TrpH
MRLDLHIHTTASDGAWSPEKVVAGAMHGGLDVIAVADHDTVASVAAAQAAGLEAKVQVIAAMEASSTWQGREVHVLGYFLDITSEALKSHGVRALQLREDRMREMVRLLVEQGIEVSFEDVEAEAGPNRSSIARPHLARALKTRGHVSSVPDAFNRYIGDGHAAFVPTELQTPMEAVEMLLAAGGVPIWAHPPGDLVDSLLPLMLKAGLQGLEVYRPRNRRHDVLRLEGICRTSDLIMTGGSDWHTPDYGPSLGDFFVTGDEVQKLLTAGGM